jgi:glycosidase
MQMFFRNAAAFLLLPCFMTSVTACDGGSDGGPDARGSLDGGSDGPGDAGSDTGDGGGEWSLPPAALLDGPADWRDEIIYFIVTDRFADGDSANNGIPDFFDKNNHFKYHGGDLKGILAHTDYLKELGVTAVWITPVTENVFALGSEPNVYTGYHGYSARDMHAIDPHLADSVQEYQDFVRTMHENGLRVIQDVVVNHMGSVLKYTEGWEPAFDSGGYTRIFVDDEYPPATNSWVLLNNNQRPTRHPFDQISSYHNFGAITNWDDPEQKRLGDFGGLDDLKTESPEVRDALVEIYRDWVIYGGVDGFRLDTVVHVDETFWDAFSTAIRSKVHEMNPNARFIQFGEVFDFNHANAVKYTTGGADNPRLDSVLNFPLYDAIQKVFAQGGSTTLLTQEIAARNVLRGSAVDNGGAGLSAIDGAVNFIDNHDVYRFLDTVTVSGDVETRKQIMRCALSYLLTTNGIPAIYYNTENDTTGDPAMPPNHVIKGDYARYDMPDFVTTGKPTFDLIRELAGMRRDNVALRRGNMEVLADASNTDWQGIPLPAGSFAFARRIPGNSAEDVFVFINNSDVTASQDVIIGTGDELAEIYPATGITHVPTTERVTVTIPAYGIKLLKRI